jgi:hypothetical protein
VPKAGGLPHGRLEANLAETMIVGFGVLKIKAAPWRGVVVVCGSYIVPRLFQPC